MGNCLCRANICDCKLFTEYHHCCKIDQCFGPSHQQTEKALLSALQAYNAYYLLSTIMDYLPYAFSTNKVVSSKYYHSYTYETLGCRIEDIKMPPCQIWMRCMGLYPEFKVCDISHLLINVYLTKLKIQKIDINAW